MKLGKKARAVYKRREENKIYKASLLYNAKIEGIEEGEKRGRDQEKIEIAKNLLDILDTKTIALKTGLSIEEIERLK